MGANGDTACRLCSTPGVKITTEGQTCPGCGTVTFHEVAVWLLFEHTKVDFFTATRKYETSRSNLGFGAWLLKRNFELEARP